MYPRTEYEMTQEDLDAILNACQPVPYLIIGGMSPRSPQENANAAWADLGRKMGFDSMTVQSVAGKGMRSFTAVPCETPEQQAEREKRQRAESLQAKILALKETIEKAQRELVAVELDAKRLVRIPRRSGA